MTRWAVAFVISVLAAANIFSQKVELQAKTVSAFKPGTIELMSPWIIDGRKTTVSEEKRRKSCLDFESLSYDCRRNPGMAYGDRIGVNLDLFQIHGGVIDRTRMVEIGKYNWTDKFTVPYVEPWAPLAPGERRNITVNASGGRGADGTPGWSPDFGIVGMNGNGTYTPIPKPRPAEKGFAERNVKEQVTSTVTGSDGRVRKDPYIPNVEIKKGYMYVVHVVDQQGDYYVLIHVDDVVHGESVKLSFIKILIGEL